LSLGEKATCNLKMGLKAGGAPRMWKRIIRHSIPHIKQLVLPGSQILEVGYGDGLLSCYLVQKLGWYLTGFDISPEAHETAIKNAKRFGLEDRAEFRFCSPEETWQHCGRYDAVFIKTVLYSSPNLAEYGRRLDWIISVLRPGGVLINFETGRANYLVNIYRRIRRREYTNLCLYTSEVEALYNARFDIVFRRYYGGWSQFAAPIKGVYNFMVLLEESFRPRGPDNCFAVSIIAKKR